MKIRTVSLAVLLAVLSGCASAPKATQLPDRIPAGPIELSHVTWRLVEFRSMDDAQGTNRPSDPSKYTMKLGADGSAAFQLDCNRGMGSYTSQKAADGLSGAISFSVLATTRALCPEPSMGERIARDAQYMRGWLLRDGKLSISLMADGGVYVWEPVN
jgi:heat shock protein HslJ